MKRLLKVKEKALLKSSRFLDAVMFNENVLRSGESPYEVISEDSLMSVRYFPPLEAGEVVEVNDKHYRAQPAKTQTPLVFVPPLGASSLIFDLLPNRSLIRYFLAKGYPVYLIDWGSPDSKDAHLDLEHYCIDWMHLALTDIREHAGEQSVSLYGYCMGGLISLLYTAYHNDKHVQNIVSVAAPVDAHEVGIAGDALKSIDRLSQLVGKLEHRFFSLTHEKHFHIPGPILSLIFQSTSPTGALRSYWDLLMNLSDEAYVEENTAMRFWFTKMLDYPGGATRTIVRRFMVNNELVRDNFEMRGKKVSLENIHCNLLCIAGEQDAITSQASAEALLAGISSHDKTFFLAPGGHAGVFGGRKAADFVWPFAETWLSNRLS